MLVGQAVVAAGNLMLVPVYLTHWGAQVYGEWLTMYAVVGYLSSLDFGMYTAVVNRLTQQYALKDRAGYARTYATGLRFYVLLATVGLAVVGAGVALTRLSRWLGLRETPPWQASIVMLLLAAQLFWAMPVGFMASVYRSAGDLSTTVWIGNAQRGATYGLVAAALVLGANMTQVAALQLAPLLVIGSIVYFASRRRFGTWLGTGRDTDWSLLRLLVGPSLGFLAVVLSNALVQQGSVLLISSTLGGVTVALFATSRTVINLVRQGVGLMNNALWPDVTTLDAQGLHQRLRRMHHLLVAVSSAAAIAAAAALWYIGDDIVRVWTSVRLEPDLRLMRALSLWVALQAPWLASSLVPAASNRNTRLAWSYLASAVVGLVTAGLLLRSVGVVGIPLGLMVGEAIACYHFVVKDTCTQIGEPYGTFARRLWSRWVLVAMLTLAAGWLASQVPAGFAPLRWATVGASTGAASGLVFWFAWLDAQDRRILRSQVLRRLHRARAIKEAKAFSPHGASHNCGLDP